MWQRAFLKWWAMYRSKSNHSQTKYAWSRWNYSIEAPQVPSPAKQILPRGLSLENKQVWQNAQYHPPRMCLQRWHIVIFVSATHQTGHNTRLFYNGSLGRDRSITSQGSNPAGLMLVIGSLSSMWAWWACWTLTHLIYYVSLAHAPVHSLN